MIRCYPPVTVFQQHLAGVRNINIELGSSNYRSQDLAGMCGRFTKVSVFQIESPELSVGNSRDFSCICIEKQSYLIWILGGTFHLTFKVSTSTLSGRGPPKPFRIKPGIKSTKLQRLEFADAGLAFLSLQLLLPSQFQRV